MKQVSYPREKMKVLLLENVSPRAVELFKSAGYYNVQQFKGALSEAALKEQLVDTHILGIRSKTKLTKAMLEAAPMLLAIGCFCIGTDQVDKDAARDLGIAVFNAPFSNTRSVAELVLGAMLMLIRRVPDKNKAAHEGFWQKDSEGCRELRGKVLGIIGYGNIGAQVSVLAEALGLKVIFYDPQVKLPLGNAQAKPSIEQVLQEADIVSLHIPGGKATRNLFDEALLAKCKPGALFINYSRGEVVDYAALAAALESGRLGGVAADVFPMEPEHNGASFQTPLQGLPNVLLTPHIGGATEEAQLAIGMDVSSRLLAFIECGNSQGSHTIPELNLSMQEGAYRLLHIHQNKPGVLSAVNSIMSTQGINILGQYLKTNEQTGFVVLDVDQPPTTALLEQIRALPATIRLRTVF
ncbi:MAG: phosphoglycerate dehydrogenase [Bacteroidetes bacterium]|nr:phosphoglycerate dehydrogenase [Bacteroidota bacterium]